MESERSGGLLLRGVAFVVASVAMLWQKAAKDGTLAAAARQGADEIGDALKASRNPSKFLNPAQF